MQRFPPIFFPPPFLLKTLLFVSRSVRSIIFNLFIFFCFDSDLCFAMAGAIIENMSTKKLVIVGVILLLFQAFAFMVGGLIGKFLFFLFLLLPSVFFLSFI